MSLWQRSQVQEMLPETRRLTDARMRRVSMDYGGFILFLLLALALLVWLLVTVGLFAVRSSLTLCGRYLYQVYWLDEKLWGAAVGGDVQEVRSLLKAGANPNSTGEDGSTALSVAQNAEVAALLQKAGAHR